MKDILSKVLDGGGLEFEEAVRLLDCCREDFFSLIKAADVVRRRFCGDSIDLCSLINAKSGLCSEDCKFCAQSAKYNTGCSEYGFVDINKILEHAETAKGIGVSHFCIVTSGKSPTRDEFKKIKDAIIEIKRNVGIDVDCSLGKVTMEWIKELKELGISRYNHNLETSEDFYGSMCTTHPFSDRVKMVNRLKEIGLEPCCGGIIGLGETKEQRIKLLFNLKELGIKCVPINILNPVKGTPLEKNELLNPVDIIKVIAVARLILPRSIIKIAGGREYALRDFQAMAFMAGANGMIIGGYLTTRGRSIEQDLQMVRDLGFDMLSRNLRGT